MKKQSVQELRGRVEGYFLRCGEERRPPTVTGLCLALGLSSREELGQFREEKAARIIRTALLQIENSAEEKLFSKEYYNGAKLFLEVNFSRWSGEQGDGFDAPADLAATGTGDWAK